MLKSLILFQDPARVSRDYTGSSSKLQVNSQPRITRWTPPSLVWTENNRIAGFVS